MTSCLISVALLLTPAPLNAPKETTWVSTSPPTVSTAGFAPTTFVSFLETLDVAESSYVATEKPAAIEEPPPPEPDPPPPPMTLRERALNRLAELGAPQWVLNAFDCVGWFESRWQNVRSRTGDTGVLQLNDVHRPELWRLGLDPWVPEDAATFSWLLFTRAGWSFRDWTTRGLCGLR